MVGSKKEDRFYRKIYGLEDERGGGLLAWNSIFGEGCFHRYSVVCGTGVKKERWEMSMQLIC